MFVIFAVVSKFVPALFAVSATCADKPFFFFIPRWYEYLPTPAADFGGGCDIVFKVPDGFLLVGLAIVDMLLRLGGLVATFAIIVAGVGYITAGGDAQKAASARRRIYNGVIGLVIVFVATGLVAFLGNYLAP